MQSLEASVEFTSRRANTIWRHTDYNEMDSIIAGVGTLAHVIRRMTIEDRRDKTIDMACDMLRTYLDMLADRPACDQSRSDKT